MRNYLYSTLVLFGFLLQTTASRAQNFFSAADSLITIRSIGVLPVQDNVEDIYSRNIESFLIESIQNNHRFEYSAFEFSGEKIVIDQLENNSSLRAKIFENANADALLSVQIIKNPRTINIKINMFLARDKSLILQEEASVQKTDIQTIKGAIKEGLEKLFNDLPYQGTVLSRQGTKVTVNLGRRDGLEDNQILSVVQILKLTRHPKFNFLISTEKETIGKIKVLKVEETLSFGRVVTEKEPDIIQVFSKISGIDPVSYKNTNSLNDNNVDTKDPSQALEDEITYGKNPNAWLPQHQPTFGKITASLGLGSYSESVTRSTTSLDSDGFYPFFALTGEAWITSEWSAHIGLRQGLFSASNPQAGGSPSDLSKRLSSYELLFGYNFRLGQMIQAPRIELLAGYSTYRLYTDSSNPAGLTTKSYSGFKTGVTGSYPIPEVFQGSVGAELYIFWATNMSESPDISGSSDNNITQFTLFLEQDWRTNLRFRYALDFELYNSTFTGTTTSSSSQKLTNLSAGIAYYF